MARPRPIAVIAAGSVLLALYFIYIYARGKCNMSANLLPLFLYSTNLLNSIKAEYWIDYGTLLGGVREKSLLAHEFDLDLAAREEECPKIIAALKDRVNADGKFFYEQGEWVGAKYNPLMGSDGYLHKPCLRIYDEDHNIYVDIDWYKTFTPAQVKAMQAAVNGKSPVDRATLPVVPEREGGLDLPAKWSGEENLLCNEEGITGGDPGGCRAQSWIFPLKQFTFANGLETLEPSIPERSLEVMYGDDWMVPRGKGYKRLVCLWFPQSVGTVSLLVLLTAILPTIFYIALVHVRAHGFVRPTRASLHAAARGAAVSPSYARLQQKDFSITNV